MRVISGKFKGHRLVSVGTRNSIARLRPTSDKVRESIFNLLSCDKVVIGAHVLDLFAGTGALALEALSRGASKITLVENSRFSLNILRQNIALLDVGDKAKVIPQDATKLGKNQGKRATVLFLDPPYGMMLGERAFSQIIKGGWLSDRATIIWEENAPVNPPDGFALKTTRKYGDTYISILNTTTNVT
ncbi:MAG: 16S rRNA (guanine(966)-N(2))-methyltransferase RsmD [Aestuariivita sp.]|nr:16S rRNA (guanine(966)-N(2))-methyltransferase RsmD [Aestuariivita sp.]